MSRRGKKDFSFMRFFTTAIHLCGFCVTCLRGLDSKLQEGKDGAVGWVPSQYLKLG